MGVSAERLAEIDRELLAFGKSEDELRAVVERARALRTSIEDLDADLAALARGEGEASAPAAMPPAPSAPSGSEPSGSEPSGSEPSASEPSGSARVAAEAAAELDGPVESSSDIAGLSVDELFADVEPSADAADGGGLADLFDDVQAPAGAALDEGLGDLFDDELTDASDPSGRGELADLFDDDAPAGGSSDLAELFDDEAPAAAGPAAEPDGELADLFDDPPTSKEAAASAPPELSPFSDEDEEITGSFSAADVAALEAQVASEADVELVLDEPALELDEDPVEDTRPGLISRILGRK